MTKTKPAPKPIHCHFCNSTNILVNIARTVFCQSCDYGKTKKGNIFRTISHPKFSSLGWRIRKDHSDYDELKKTSSHKKPNALIFGTKSQWARDN